MTEARDFKVDTYLRFAIQNDENTRTGHDVYGLMCLIYHKELLNRNQSQYASNRSHPSYFNCKHFKFILEFDFA